VRQCGGENERTNGLSPRAAQRWAIFIGSTGSCSGMDNGGELQCTAQLGRSRYQKSQRRSDKVPRTHANRHTSFLYTHIVGGYEANERTGGVNEKGRLWRDRTGTVRGGAGGGALRGVVVVVVAGAINNPTDRTTTNSTKSFCTKIGSWTDLGRRKIPFAPCLAASEYFPAGSRPKDFPLPAGFRPRSVWPSPTKAKRCTTHSTSKKSAPATVRGAGYRRSAYLWLVTKRKRDYC
jgi:hypothetical protein